MKGKMVSSSACWTALAVFSVIGRGVIAAPAPGEQFTDKSLRNTNLGSNDSASKPPPNKGLLGGILGKTGLLSNLLSSPRQKNSGGDFDGGKEAVPTGFVRRDDSEEERAFPSSTEYQIIRPTFPPPLPKSPPFIRGTQPVTFQNRHIATKDNVQATGDPNSHIPHLKPPLSHKTNKTGADTPSKIIERDICVIGGGAEGAYASFSLKEKGKSLVIIEQTDRLGDVPKAYKDPSTGRTIDVGEELFYNISTVRDFFSKLKIPVANKKLSNNLPLFDFSTGKRVNKHDLPNRFFARAEYRKIFNRYPQLSLGLESLPYPVSRDLVMPFGEFIKKYQLQGITYEASLFTRGVSNILEQPTLYILKAFNPTSLDAMDNGFLVPKEGNSSALYTAIQRRIEGRSKSNDPAASILFNSSVKLVNRTTDGVRATVNTPTGLVEVRAKKLVFAIRPRAENLSGFDFDATERSLFSKIQTGGGGLANDTGGAVATVIVRMANLNINETIYNASPEAKYNVPRLPSSYEIRPLSIPDHYLVQYGCSDETTKRDYQSDTLINHQIVRDLTRIQGGAKNATVPEIVYFTRRTTLFPGFDQNVIGGPEYKILKRMQGYRDTYYTCWTFDTEAHSLIWDYTAKVVLPKLLAQL